MLSTCRKANGRMEGQADKTRAEGTRSKRGGKLAGMELGGGEKGGGIECGEPFLNLRLCEAAGR